MSPARPTLGGAKGSFSRVGPLGGRATAVSRQDGDIPEENSPNPTNLSDDSAFHILNFISPASSSTKPLQTSVSTESTSIASEYTVPKQDTAAVDEVDEELMFGSQDLRSLAESRGLSSTSNDVEELLDQ